MRLERFPITWNHVIDKESLKIKILEQVLIEKVCQLFRNLPLGAGRSVTLQPFRSRRRLDVRSPSANLLRGARD
ncbi:hypothetical protein F7D13_10130 [Methylocystis rosea]|uniref:Uncharacterized protein n=1 Tax=Methylocystis rosea TaxID=173366 RepID=A0ABX6EKF0_9HYPH|nr:hypothetical protein F7D13_10130 [Methylocystis rosea]